MTKPVSTPASKTTKSQLCAVKKKGKCFVYKSEAAYRLLIAEKIYTELGRKRFGRKLLRKVRDSRDGKIYYVYFDKCYNKLILEANVSGDSATGALTAGGKAGLEIFSQKYWTLSTLFTGGYTRLKGKEDWSLKGSLRLNGIIKPWLSIGLLSDYISSRSEGYEHRFKALGGLLFYMPGLSPLGNIDQKNRFYVSPWFGYQLTTPYVTPADGTKGAVGEMTHDPLFSLRASLKKTFGSAISVKAATMLVVHLMKDKQRGMHNLEWIAELGASFTFAKVKTATFALVAQVVLNWMRMRPDPALSPWLHQYTGSLKVTFDLPMKTNK